jgi:hypothetical protein
LRHLLHPEVNKTETCQHENSCSYTKLIANTIMTTIHFFAEIFH